MPRILVLTPTVGRGGVTNVVHKMTRGLAALAPRDWCFDILGQQYNEIGEKVDYPPSLSFTQIKPIDRLPAHPHHFPYLWEHCDDFYNHMMSVINDYDLCYCLSPWWIIRATKWSLPIPIVAFVPDFAFDEVDMGMLLTPHFRVASQLLQHRASMTTFGARHYQNHAVNVYGFTPEKTHVIEHSIDFVAENYTPTPEEAARVRAKYKLPERYVLAFHVASGHKDPETILRAQLYARQHSANVPPLVLAGIETERFKQTAPDAQPIMRIRRVIRDIGATLGKDLFILGQVPDADIAGLFAGASVAVSASRMEGDLAGGTFNAFMARCPHIYSDLPVYIDRIGRDAMGWCFPVGDSVALGERLVEACTQHEEARRRAERAYQFAQQRTIKDVVADYLDVFERCLSSVKV